ncbi:MAG: phage portal protein [Elusimicrobiaceae bacterium]|nr:phage portal protein [Elusimicrobiaceae bacterium]
MILATESKQNISDLKYIETKINNWCNSIARKEQINGERYYYGDHDILRKKRTILGENGELQEVSNLPNNRNVDNQYAKMVDQKKNYLLGQPISFDSEDKEYVELLKKVFNKRVQKTLKDLGGLSIRGGIAWLYPYYSDNELKFKIFPAYEILPFWNDTAHTDLNMAVRLYWVEKPNAVDEDDKIQKVEIYTKNGIDHYTFENNRLIPDVVKPHENYLSVTAGDTTTAYNWERIPLIPFKRNAEEKSLLKDCKNLQDAINDIISTFKNNMEEDARNTILVLENYDGQNLGEFRRNLANYGAVKVRSGDGAGRGDVRTLTVEVNSGNYEAILKVFKTALIENCKGYDFSEFRSGGGTPNQMNIKSIYSDIDLDANDMQTEYESSFEDLLWFVNKYLSTSGKGNYENVSVDVIFNRDGVVNESEIMQMLTAAGVRISNKTLLGQVSFIDDVEEELKRLKDEEKEALDAYGGSLPMNGGVNDYLQNNKQNKR